MNASTLSIVGVRLPNLNTILHNSIMRRIESLVIKIAAPTNRKRFWLESMSQAFTDAVQYCLNDAEKQDIRGRGQIHKSCYRDIRELLGLPSDYARMVVNQSVSMIRSYHALRKSRHQKTTSFPKARKSQGIGLGVASYKIVDDEGRYVIRCSTGTKGSYVWLPLCVPAKYRHLMASVYGDARVYEKNGDWYVSLPVRYEIEAPTVCDGEHMFIGVDLGIVRIATVAYPDRVEFFNGKEIRHRREHFADLRRRYQRHNRRDRVRGSRKESNWMRDINHKISRQIVNAAAEYESPIIVLENLEGIRRRTRRSKKFNRMMSGWTFRQLKDFLMYKAERLGIPVVFVDPRDTSKTCSKCGHCSRSNRPDQSHFVCEVCGYAANADYNASRNIAARGLEVHAQGLPDTARSSDQTDGLSHRPDGVKCAASAA
jgi:putative transposase